MNTNGLVELARRAVMPLRNSRECRAWAVVGSVCCAFALAPIWVTRFLPVLDDPNHLSALYIWHELAKPDSPLHAFYSLHIAPVSYLAYYGLAHVIGWVTGVELAHKLVLSLYVLAFPGFAWLFCRQSGRTAWLAWLSLPFAFSISWAHGYHPFNLGMVAFLGSVVVFDRMLMAASVGSFVLASACALVCYFSHPFPLALLVGCALLLWLLHGARMRGLAAVIGALVPSLLMLRWQARAGSVTASSAGEVLGREFPVLKLETYGARLLDWPAHAVNAYAGYGDSIAAIVIVVVVLGLWIAGVRAWSAEQGKTRGRAFVIAETGATRGRAFVIAREYRAFGIAVALAALYFLLPEHFNEPVYMWIARGRIAPAIGFFLLLSVPVSSASRLRWVAAAAALGLCYLPLELSVRYHSFREYMRGMEQVLAACPRGSQVLTLRLGEHTYAGFDVPVFRELPSWVQVVHGGFSPMAFDRPIAFPFAVEKPLPAPHWRNHAAYKRFVDPNVYGCVLMHRAGDAKLNPGWKIAREAGAWRLYIRR